jgi:hypothetical protein
MAFVHYHVLRPGRKKSRERLPLITFPYNFLHEIQVGYFPTSFPQGISARTGSATCCAIRSGLPTEYFIIKYNTVAVYSYI